MKAESAGAVLEFLVPAIENEAALTRKVILAVPAEKGHFRPEEKAMSALELCWHIAAADAFFLTAVTTGVFPPFTKMPDNVKTPKDVVAWFDAQVSANVAKLKTHERRASRENRGVSIRAAARDRVPEFVD